MNLVLVLMAFDFAGKSTLLNHLFRTKFREMDAYSGRLVSEFGIDCVVNFGFFLLLE